MTYEELKTEAKKQGYKLIKINKPERLLPCVCGRKSRTRYYSWDGDVEITTLVCKGCGRTVRGTSKTSVNKAWNKMIRGIINDNQ